MAKQLNPLGLSFRVLLYFARNPEEELTAHDVSVKFEVDVVDVRPMLRRALENEWIAQPVTGGGRGNSSVYCPGPALLQMIGFPMDGCAPAGNVPVSVGGR